MKTFKFITFAFCLFSIFNAMPVVATTTPMTDLTPAKKIYPPFLIFDEGGEIAICTTREGIKDGMRFETKHGSYKVWGDSISGPTGWYRIDVTVSNIGTVRGSINTPSGKWYSWSEDSVGEYKIWSNEITGPTGTYILDNTGVLSPTKPRNDCVDL